MTPADLRFAEENWKAQRRIAEQARLHRNALFHEAILAGWTHARIAEATGLSRARVGQLAPKR